MITKITNSKVKWLTLFGGAFFIGLIGSALGIHFVAIMLLAGLWGIFISGISETKN